MANDAIYSLLADFKIAIKVRPLLPIKKPWSTWTWVKAAALASVSLGGTFVVYRLVVKSPVYHGAEVDMCNKIVLVTEATGRMSRDFLRQLAERNSHIILTSAYVDDCENARNKLLRSTGVEEVQVDCRRLDLDSMRSIRRFAGAILKDYPRIDRLVIQPPAVLSGIVAGVRRPTHDAFEYQLGTNFFSYYLLTRLLLPSLERAGKDKDRDARVIFMVDMRAAQFAESVAERDEVTGSIRLPLEHWNWDDGGYTPAGGYQRAQWALRLFADELAKMTRGSGVSVLIADPAVHRTSPPEKDSSNENPVLSLFFKIGRSFFNLGYIITRIVPQRVASTEFMCSVAKPPNVELTGDLQSCVSLEDTAPVYKNLKRVPEPFENTRRTEARELLWTLSQKWSRLDTHPEPVPLPPRMEIPTSN